MTLRDYLRIVRERWVIVLVAVAIGTGGTLGFSLRQPPRYTATARVLVQPSPVARSDGLAAALGVLRSVETEAEVVRSAVVAERVIARLRLRTTVQDALEDVEVVPVPSTEVLAVNATASRPADARSLADAFAEEYLAYRHERELDATSDLSAEVQKRLGRARRQLRELDARLRRTPARAPGRSVLELDRDNQLATVAGLQVQLETLLQREDMQRAPGEIIQPASLPDAPSSPNHPQNLILGLLVSLPLGLGLALLRDSMSDTVRTKEDAERITRADVLALVPADPHASAARRVATRDDPTSAAAESYRSLRVTLELSRGRGALGTVLVTSPGRGEGKSATAANLAVAFAESGRRTVLVSADLRRPRLHELFGEPRSPGLTEMIESPGGAADGARVVAPNLRLVPSGTAEGRPDLWLARSGAATALRALGEDAEVVVVDAPPVLQAAEAAALAPLSDGVVLVLFSGVTTRAAAARAAEQIRRVGGLLLGVALVGVTEDSTGDGASDER